MPSRPWGENHAFRDVNSMDLACKSTQSRHKSQSLKVSILWPFDSTPRFCRPWYEGCLGPRFAERNSCRAAARGEWGVTVINNPLSFKMFPSQQAPRTFYRGNRLAAAVVK
jgi:hypothetical protein